jgi:hypothetical protein
MRDISEREAAKRWCPHTRYPIEVAEGIWVTVNRSPTEAKPQWVRCIGSLCIYWEQGKYIVTEKDISGHCAYGMSK